MDLNALPNAYSRSSSRGEQHIILVPSNSDRPLLLLAGEIVTGGKQDRVIGADRIVPPKSDPVDLSVFPVDPATWVSTAAKPSSANVEVADGAARRTKCPAMAAKNQQQVWDQVAAAREAAETASNLAVSPGASQPALT